VSQCIGRGVGQLQDHNDAIHKLPGYKLYSKSIPMVITSVFQKSPSKHMK